MDNNDKPVKKHHKTSQRDKQIIELMDSNVRTCDIAKIVDIHPNSVSRLKADLSKYSISSDKKLAKGLKKCTHKIMNDYLLDNNSVKPSDVLKLTEMQQSRIDPVVQHVETKSTSLVAVINLNEVQ